MKRGLAMMGVALLSGAELSAQYWVLGDGVPLTDFGFSFTMVNQQSGGAITGTVQPPLLGARAGLMFRTSLDPGTPVVALVTTEDGQLALVDRDAGAQRDQRVETDPTRPIWLRLSARPPAAFSADKTATLVAATSLDGVTWRTVATLTKAALPIWMGVAIDTGNAHRLNTVVSAVTRDTFPMVPWAPIHLALAP